MAKQIRWARRNVAMGNDLIWERLCVRVDDAKVVTPPGVSVSMCQANTESVPGRLGTVATAEGDNNKDRGPHNLIRRPVARDRLRPPGIIHNKYTRVRRASIPWFSFRIRGALVPWFSLTRLPTSSWNLMSTRQKEQKMAWQKFKAKAYANGNNKPESGYIHALEAFTVIRASASPQYGTEKKLASGSKSQYILTINIVNSLVRKNDARRARKYCGPSPIGEVRAIKILAKTRLFPRVRLRRESNPRSECAREIGAQLSGAGQRHESSSVVFKCGRKLIKSSREMQYCAGSKVRLEK